MAIPGDTWDSSEEEMYVASTFADEGLSTDEDGRTAKLDLLKMNPLFSHGAREAIVVHVKNFWRIVCWIGVDDELPRVQRFEKVRASVLEDDSAVDIVSLLVGLELETKGV